MSEQETITKAIGFWEKNNKKIVIILGSLIIVVGGYFAYTAISNRYFETVTDKWGRVRRRDIRNGRFVKTN